MKNSLKLLKEIIEQITDLEIQENDLEMIDDLLYTKNDFNFEINNREYRCINADAIWSIYRDEQEELIKDVYFAGKDFPWWVEIDWERTCENVFNSDGYGNNFATYDGVEETFKYKEEQWYVFRTN